MYIVYFVFMDLYISGFLSNIASNSFYESKGNEENTFLSSTYKCNFLGADNKQ